MPTYEYVCKSCGDNIEVFQSFNARPLRKHVECGGELKKIFHARGVVFKGSGFYKTDSRGAETNGNATDTKTKRSGNGKADDKTATSPSKDSSASTSGN